MARFPYYKKNVAALGKLLAEARLNLSQLDKLNEDTKLELVRIGLPASVTDLIDFKIVDGSMCNAVAIPYKLNTRKLETGNKSYLASLATSITKIN